MWLKDPAVTGVYIKMISIKDFAVFTHKKCPLFVVSVHKNSYKVC